MNYVRLGMPIQELAFLGRWKSSVVLSYAEDALQSEPANRNIANGSSAKSKKSLVAPESRSSPVIIRDSLKDVEGKNLGKDLVVTQLPKKLWVASTAYNSRERVWHEVEGASWDVPMESWSSVCGWPFSRNSSKVALQSQLTLSKEMQEVPEENSRRGHGGVGGKFNGKRLMNTGLAIEVPKNPTKRFLLGACSRRVGGLLFMPLVVVEEPRVLRDTRVANLKEWREGGMTYALPSFE